jgi:hypothetical protein
LTPNFPRPRALSGPPSSPRTPPDRGRQIARQAPGEVAEWSIAPHSKCGIGASLSGVRIPPSPPDRHCPARTDRQHHVPKTWVTFRAELGRRALPCRGATLIGVIINHVTLRPSCIFSSGTPDVTEKWWVLVDRWISMRLVRKLPSAQSSVMLTCGTDHEDMFDYHPFRRFRAN